MARLTQAEQMPLGQSPHKGTKVDTLVDGAYLHQMLQRPDRTA